MRTIVKETDQYTVSYVDSFNMRNLVFEKVLEWIFKHEAFLGEVIVQSDECNIDAPDLIAGIVDEIIKFDWNSK